MKRAAIIAKHGKPELDKVVKAVAGWLRDHGYAITADSISREFCGPCDLGEREDLDKIIPDFVVVLGGDGTLLSVARNAAPSDIPILGVNLGSLGFLTEVKQQEILDMLETIHAGKSGVSERAMLHCELLRNGKTAGNYDALNDVVVHQSALARITDFDVRVDGAFVANYKADGLIVSTPTGSTAYSLAAGGPILAPDVAAFVITPVAPHALTNRPLVVRDSAVISISIERDAESVFLTVDGQQGTLLTDGDIVMCRKSKMKVKLMRLPDRSFFDVLRTKLKWGER